MKLLGDAVADFSLHDFVKVVGEFEALSTDKQLLQYVGEGGLQKLSTAGLSFVNKVSQCSKMAIISRLALAKKILHIAS